MYKLANQNPSILYTCTQHKLLSQFKSNIMYHGNTLHLTQKCRDGGGRLPFCNRGMKSNRPATQISFQKWRHPSKKWTMRMCFLPLNCEIGNDANFVAQSEDSLAPAALKPQHSVVFFQMWQQCASCTHAVKCHQFSTMYGSISRHSLQCVNRGKQARAPEIFSLQHNSLKSGYSEAIAWRGWI